MGRGASLAAGLAVGAALAGGLAGGALAAGEDESKLGQHVASCAQIHLGQRENPPTLTCEHDGHVHTFATFGAVTLNSLEFLQRESGAWHGRVVLDV